MVEQPSPGIPSLGHTRGEVDAFLRAGIEVDVEVLGLENLKLELLVMDLVAPEIFLGERRPAPCGETTSARSSAAAEPNMLYHADPICYERAPHLQ